MMTGDLVLYEGLTDRKTLDSMPSSGEGDEIVVRKPLGEVENTTETEPGREIMPSIERTNELPSMECVFKRGGWCINHGCKGDKRVIKSQVWKKKKNGLYGYVTSTTTKYSCMWEKTEDSKPGTENDMGDKSMATSAQGLDQDVQYDGIISNRFCGSDNRRGGAK